MSEKPKFFEPLEEMDPEFEKALSETYGKATEEGALSSKVKTLISLALDAAEGHEKGVSQLAEKARAQGASEEEIVETLEVATALCGVQALAIGAYAFGEPEGD